MKPFRTISFRTISDSCTVGACRPEAAALPPRVACLILLASLFFAAPGHGETTAILADGRELSGVELKPGPAADQITLEPTKGPPVTIPIQELLVIDFGKLPGRLVTPTVRMTNGDQVYGSVTFPGPKQVSIAAGWGAFSLPLAWCSAIRLDDKADLPTASGSDTLLVAGDRVEGQITSIRGGKVAIKVGGVEIPVPLSRVKAMALASTNRPPENRDGLVLALDLGGGERVTGRWVKLTPDLLTIKTDWGENLDVPVGSLSRLEVKNGRLVYLSDLRPSESRHVPYLDGAYPFRVDRAVSGRPLTLGGKVYARGLGVHSRSEVTYTLDGSFATFQAVIGIDDAVLGEGSVIFRVFGDDRSLFESPVMRGGDKPVEVKVPVRGVVLLRLEVDYADNGDLADHGDWADARLLRP